MIKKINVDKLYPNEEVYNKTRLEYIAEYEEYHSGGIFSSGYYIKNPKAAEAIWENKYPNGFKDWRDSNAFQVCYSDLKMFEEKINEIIEVANHYKNK